METKFQNIPIELPEPWYWDNVDLTIELRREICEQHVLFSKSLKTIGRRLDNDDVLFQLENDSFMYAVVHLTWTENKELNPLWPITAI